MEEQVEVDMELLAMVVILLVLEVMDLMVAPINLVMPMLACLIVLVEVEVALTEIPILISFSLVLLVEVEEVGALIILVAVVEQVAVSYISLLTQLLFQDT